MYKKSFISFCFYCLLLPSVLKAETGSTEVSFDFFGTTVFFRADNSFVIPLKENAGKEAIISFCKQLETSNSKSTLETLLSFKKEHKLDDWLYYQLIRKTAQQLSPKAENYYRYTLYKWFLLSRSGYEATLRSSNDKLLFYVRSDENIYNVPYYIKNSMQFVCLNYHDYGANIDFQKELFTELELPETEEKQAFSYKITRLPDFNITDYKEKDIQFSYYKDDYHFKIKLNPQIKTIFANYPVVDYESYFNIPLSNETYRSLIPLLKQNTSHLSIKNGVEYLMQFTRHAFLFRPDNEVFGSEKRFSPEQTLLYEESDCEDRAALFFYLVKEIYNLPMIVLAYPQHVTIAVGLDKSPGKPIVHKGKKYYVCEPTSQNNDLPIGRLSPQLKKLPYEIAYAYNPEN